MGGTWYRFRAEMRHGGWRFVLITAVLLGIGGAIALASIAGARRTDTAFERLAEATIAADVLVNPDSIDTLDEITDAKIAEVDGIVAYGRVYGIASTYPDGIPFEPAFLAASDDRYGHTIERPVVREGRLPDPSRADEVFANPEAAEIAGLEVGDRFELVVLNRADGAREELLEMSFEELSSMIVSGEIGSRAEFTLVGIGVVTSDVVPGGALETFLATPAFWNGPAEPFGFFGALSVRLTDRPGAVDAFLEATRNIVPGLGIDFQTTEADRGTIERSVRPQVVALLAFGLVTALAVVAATAQAFSRRAKAALVQDPALAGLGMSELARRRLHVLRIAIVALVAPIIMVIVAWLLSTIFPVGLARFIEPERGLRFDASAVLGGCVVLVVATVLVSYAAVRVARRDIGRRLPGLRRLTSAATSTLPPTVATGVRLAVESGDSTRTVPAKSTIVSAAIGVTVIIGTLSFAASLDRFVTSPPSYGWEFDALVGTGDIGETDELEAYGTLQAGIGRIEGVEGWAPAFLQQAPVGDGNVPAMGLGAGGGGDRPHPTVVRGRLPANENEIALGAVTMRELGVDIGDTVTAGFDDRPFEIVGMVVLPGLRAYEGSDQAALGVGALFDELGFMIATSLGFQGDNPPNVLLVNLDESTPERFAAVQAGLDELFGEDYFSIEGPSEPSDVTGYARVRSTPIVLAAILGVLAALTVGHGLIVSVRQRRRDFAIFRALGFTRRQVSATVGWQASTVAVIAAVVGVPLGLLLGRVAWSSVAHRLGIVNAIVTPWWAVVLAVPAALVLANLVAAIPARLGVRLRPGQELRAE